MYKISLSGFCWLLVPIGVLLAILTNPAPAAERNELSMQAGMAQQSIDLTGRTVCGDEQHEARGLLAAAAIAKKLPGWQTLLRNGTCTDQLADTQAIATGKTVVFPFATVLQAQIGDVLVFVYVVIPTPRNHHKLQFSFESGRPTLWAPLLFHEVKNIMRRHHYHE